MAEVAVFATLDAFRAWHKTACADHGIPSPGVAQRDGRPEPSAWTTAYAQAFQVGGVGVYFVGLSAEDVARYRLQLATARDLTDIAAARALPPGSPLGLVWTDDHMPLPSTYERDGLQLVRNDDGTYERADPARLLARLRHDVLDTLAELTGFTADELRRALSLGGPT